VRALLAVVGLCPLWPLPHPPLPYLPPPLSHPCTPQPAPICALSVMMLSSILALQPWLLSRSSPSPPLPLSHPSCSPLSPSSFFFSLCPCLYRCGSPPDNALRLLTPVHARRPAAPFGGKRRCCGGGRCRRRRRRRVNLASPPLRNRNKVLRQGSGCFPVFFLAPAIFTPVCHNSRAPARGHVPLPQGTRAGTCTDEALGAQGHEGRAGRLGAGCQTGDGPVRGGREPIRRSG